MIKAAILQEGNIYFFLRPKVDHSSIKVIEDVQHAMLLLQPKESSKYILLIIGKKHLPEESGQSYFTFISKVFSSYEDVVDSLKQKDYSTKTKGERHLLAATSVGYGKYIIYSDNGHSYLAYKLAPLRKDMKIKSIFKLKKSDSFVIQVKNTNKYPPFHKDYAHGTIFPKKLAELFGEHKFIPLNPIDFLYYEGAEILLIGRKEGIAAELNECMNHLKLESLKNFEIS
jgi:hypothetical protein